MFITGKARFTPGFPEKVTQIEHKILIQNSAFAGG